MDNKFPVGIRSFKPNPNAPSFIKGDILINSDELTEWLSSQPKEVRLQLKESKDGKYYLEINNYQPQKDNFKPQVDSGFNKNKPGEDLPF